MAQRLDETSTMLVRVEIGSGDNVSYKNRTFNYVAPTATDDNVLSFGTRYGALQTHTVNAVLRRDLARLASD